ELGRYPTFLATSDRNLGLSKMLCRALHKPTGDLGLVHHRPALGALGRDQMDRISVATHCAALLRNVVGDDPVAAFSFALLLRELDDILRFRGEADNKCRAHRAATGDRLEDVRVLHECE